MRPVSNRKTIRYWKPNEQFPSSPNINPIQISHTPMNKSSQLKVLRGPLTALVAAVALFSIAGCGSTSTLKNTQGQAITSTRKVTKVTVKTFKLQLEDKDPEMNSEKSPAYFADRIAFEIKSKGGFASVGRDTKPDANTLLIDGVITKYHEGNPMLRGFIGMGAGS